MTKKTVSSVISDVKKRLRPWVDLPSIRKHLWHVENQLALIRFSQLETQLSWSALNSNNEGLNAEPRKQSVVVSLTSYGARINDAYLVIENMMNQSLKPDRICLWLSEREFANVNLPKLLERQVTRGLEIGFTEDMLSYKKLIPALQRHPNDLIITVDDDILYPATLIERLYNAYEQSPELIHCWRAHKMTFDSTGQLKPYMQWDWETGNREPGLNIFPTGGAGTLYFPNCFDPEVLNYKQFLSLAPTADDIWFKLMSLRKGTRCRVLPGAGGMSGLCSIPNTAEHGLFLQNQLGNDEILQDVLAQYPDIREKISHLASNSLQSKLLDASSEERDP